MFYFYSPNIDLLKLAIPKLYAAICNSLMLYYSNTIFPLFIQPNRNVNEDTYFPKCYFIIHIMHYANSSIPLCSSLCNENIFRSINIQTLTNTFSYFSLPQYVLWKRGHSGLVVSTFLSHLWGLRFESPLRPFLYQVIFVLRCITFALRLRLSSTLLRHFRPSETETFSNVEDPVLV